MSCRLRLTLWRAATEFDTMIDVVFLLIIFFMVGARFTEEANDQKFEIELPTQPPVQIMSRTPERSRSSSRQEWHVTMRKRSCHRNSCFRVRTPKLPSGPGRSDSWRWRRELPGSDRCDECLPSGGIRKFHWHYKPTDGRFRKTLTTSKKPDRLNREQPLFRFRGSPKF